jgi:hypothetical protein
MKKILITLAMLVTLTAQAHGQWHHHGGYYGGYHGGYNNNWVAPAVIGAVIGGGIAYEMSRPVVVQPQPVVIQPQPVVVQPPPVTRTGFYCQTSGFFYPQVQTCNVPWQSVNY